MDHRPFLTRRTFRSPAYAARNQEIVVLAALLIGPVAASIPTALPAAEVARICAVGRVALQDLPRINHAPPWETFYNGRTDAYHRDLLEVCPDLRLHLPTGFKLADDAVFKRRSDISASSPVVIFDVEVPELSADMNRATVRMGYACNGLCGATFEATYVRAATGWKREGEPRIISVS